MLDASSLTQANPRAGRWAAWGVRVALLVGLLAGACKESDEPSGSDEPSPNASILPSPLVSQRPLPLVDAGKPTSGEVDGGAPDAQAPISPVYFSLEGPLGADVAAPRDSLALNAKASFSWVPRPPGSGASRPGSFPVSVGFAPHGRMRLVLESEHMALPSDTEFRSRIDRYGHILVWPQQTDYRVLAPGTIRGLLQERRADMGPLLDGSFEDRGKGRLLGVATRKDAVQGPMGSLLLEQARLAGVGSAGQLLCRFLLELVLVKPDAVVCLADHLPLKAEYTWENGGQLTFSVSLVTEKAELSPADFMTPPRRATFRRGELPPARPPLLVSESELAGLSPDPKAKPHERPNDEDLPGKAKVRGLRLDNAFESPRFLLVNDQLVAYMSPHQGLSLERLKPGAYSLALRDFLGTETVERWAQKVPGRRVVGAEDDDKATAHPAPN